MVRILLILLCILLFTAGNSQEINIFFDFNKDDLRYNDAAKLDELVAQYKHSNHCFTLRGYTDTAGKSGYNMDLSKRRAVAVKEYLIGHGIKQEKIKVEFYGEAMPGNTEQYLNRKVEVYVEHREKRVISDYSGFIESITPAKEVFEIPVEKEVSIEAKKGTVITIPQNAFQFQNGDPVTGSVSIELSEYYSIADMFSKRLSTIAGGNLLVSNGVVDIRATKNGREIYLKDSAEIRLGFPRSSNDRFYSFYGQRRADSTMDWDLDQQLWERKQNDIGVTLSDDGQSLIVVDKEIANKKNKLNVWDRKTNTFREMTDKDRWEMDSVRKQDSTIATQQVQNFENLQKYYSTINARRLNWINCDYFLRDPSSEIINYYVTITNPEMTVFSSFLVFDNLKSILEIPFSSKELRYHSYARLPLKRAVRLLVTGTANGKFFIYFDYIKLADGKTDNIQLEESSFDEFSAILKRI